MCKWWPKRQPVPYEALQAKAEATEELREVHSKDAEVDHYVARIKTHLEENHLAETLMSAMALKPKRRRGRFRNA